jgi:hypothetical protein
LVREGSGAHVWTYPFAGILLHTCAAASNFEKVVDNSAAGRGRLSASCNLHLHLIGDGTVDNSYCLRCSRELESGQKSVAVYLFAQTVGIRPRQKSAAQRICFCPQCSVSLAMGPAPEGALNLAAWQMIRDVVGADPALTEAAWESLHGIEEGLLPATGTTGIAPAARAGSYFEF